MTPRKERVRGGEWMLFASTSSKLGDGVIRVFRPRRHVLANQESKERRRRLARAKARGGPQRRVVAADQVESTRPSWAPAVPPMRPR